ncbi:hypothetical protein [Streptomyces xantholiticus]|uniref:hypothetical protein n=1 Tax=Streptomyces xantholiticus TaxID=68285 RepID=UPI0016757C03|nr:hypothetical protein [Streptomyces xantholiticus]
MIGTFGCGRRSFRRCWRAWKRPTGRGPTAELRSLKEEFGDGVAGVAVSGNTFHGPVAFQTGSHSRQDNRFGTAG